MSGTLIRLEPEPMDIDEPELSDFLPGESSDTFRARIRLSRRVLPVLREMVNRRLSLIIESDRRSSRATSLTSDFVLELGDSRVRLLLTPDEPDPLSTLIPIDALRHYILDVPDTDAVAVVADDESLSTWVFDVYDLNETQLPNSSPLAEALGAYFEAAVHPIEIPNLRGTMALPTPEQLEDALERTARSAFSDVKGGRARIEEKVTAIGLLGPKDAEQLVGTLLQAYRSRQPILSSLLEAEAASDD